MGWFRYDAHCYKQNGTVDRKLECDRLFNTFEHCKNPFGREGEGDYKGEVLKSVMVGSVYYAAVKRTSDFRGADGKNEHKEMTFAVICLTAGNSRYDGYNFGLKEMDESCGPNASKCPNSILALLDAPCNDWSREWRDRCRAYNEEQKRKNASRKAA